MRRLIAQMKWLITWLIASVFAVSGQVNAQTITDLNALQNQLAKHDVVRGDFTQLRHIEMFDQPLSSHGHFILDKANGLLWQQIEPFEVNLVLTQDKLRQTFADQPAQIITAEQNPMAFYFSRIFLSVFHGDTQALQEQFELHLSSQDDKWVLTLKPKNAPINAVFSHIELKGNQQIEQLTLVELRGDKTEIQFSAQNQTLEPLTEAELKQFAF